MNMDLGARLYSLGNGNDRGLLRRLMTVRLNRDWMSGNRFLTYKIDIFHSKSAKKGFSIVMAIGFNMYWLQNLSKLARLAFKIWRIDGLIES